MGKTVFKGRIVILAGLLYCGCGIKPENLSTNSQENDDNIHKESTLSTGESTNVDNTAEYEASVSITYDESTENRTENAAESAFETMESTAYPEEPTESTEETAEEWENDALFYYAFYASVYQTRDENTSLVFDREAFETAYEHILQERLTDYFSDISWLMREEGISLSLTPTTLLLPEGSADANLWMARCIHAFALVEEAYSADPNWDHPDSLKPQFHCHAIYARQNKVPWNIEPYRTETSFLKIILAQGNPES